MVVRLLLARLGLALLVEDVAELLNANHTVVVRVQIVENLDRLLPGDAVLTEQLEALQPLRQGHPPSLLLVEEHESPANAVRELRLEQVAKISKNMTEILEVAVPWMEYLVTGPMVHGFVVNEVLDVMLMRLVPGPLELADQLVH